VGEREKNRCPSSPPQLTMGVVFFVLILLSSAARMRGDIDVGADVPDDATEDNPQLVEESSKRLGVHLPPTIAIPPSSGGGGAPLVAPGGRAIVQPVYPNQRDNEQPDDLAGELPPGINYDGAGGSDEPKDKLALALDAVSEDIISKSKQISEESKWMNDVKTILQSYTTKVQRVDTNIQRLRQQVKDLYNKKKIN